MKSSAKLVHKLRGRVDVDGEDTEARMKRASSMSVLSGEEPRKEVSAMIFLLASSVSRNRLINNVLYLVYIIA
ncbi:hypothetical protein SK128_024949 [Halocaridina rubra]|uniref:Uncharacterized protein n=1 Tax=Halocaridina rubra TaxID=373956 RepID=A0AAN8WHG3_HALRR